MFRHEPTNCLSVFDHFVGLALKGLRFILLRAFYKNFLKKVVKYSPKTIFTGGLGNMCSENTKSCKRNVCDEVFFVKAPESRSIYQKMALVLGVYSYLY